MTPRSLSQQTQHWSRIIEILKYYRQNNKKQIKFKKKIDEIQQTIFEPKNIIHFFYTCGIPFSFVFFRVGITLRLF